MKIYGVSGWKNSGKTTLVERLVTEITGRGFSVSTVKHAHHEFDVDQPGRDSHRHRLAGAAQVLISSRNRWALMTEHRGNEEPSMEELIAQLSPVDLVIVEGFKGAPHPKIEVWRSTGGNPFAATRLPGTEAVASDIQPPACDLPWFSLDDVGSIASFILARTELS